MEVNRGRAMASATVSVVKNNAITVPRGSPARTSPPATPGTARAGPVGTASELWSFDVLELEGPAAAA